MSNKQIDATVAADKVICIPGSNMAGWDGRPKAESGRVNLSVMGGSEVPPEHR